MRTPSRLAGLLLMVALASCTGGDQHFEKGLEHYNAGRNTEAIQSFDAALDRDPTSARAYLWRAHAFANLGNRIRAAADYRRSAELAPEQADAYYGLGYLNVEQEKWEDALVLFDKALAIDRMHFPSLVERSKVLVRKGRYEEGIRDLNGAIALKGDIAALHGMRAAALMRLRRYGEALKDYDSAVALNPNDINLRSERAEAHYVNADYQRALSDLEFAVARAGKTTYPFNNLAWFLVTTPQQHLRDGKRALMLIERAGQLEEDKKSAKSRKALHSTRAAIFAELGDFRSAVAEQEQAIILAEQIGDAANVEKQRRYLETFRAKRRLIVEAAEGFY